MNKKLVSLLFLGLSIAALKSHSHSFFQPRDISTDSTLELSLTNYHRYHQEDEENKKGIEVYLKPFIMDSTKSKKLARYFLPNNQACIFLDESGHGNIDPLWFNLISPVGTFYTSNLTLAPKRHVEGVLLTAYFDVGDRWWVGINTALIHVSTHARLRETNRAENGTIPRFANAYQAFDNDAWTAGKITNCKQGKSGLDDIQLKLGYDFYKTDDEHATLYLVGTIPTGGRSKAIYLFEPLVGSKYGSFGFGFDGEKFLYECDNHTLSLMLDFKYRYIFSARERRSFDLCQNGDWSRYLLVVTQAQPLDSQPGINLLTVPVRVTPGSTIDFWTSLNYGWCSWNFEFGYEFWWREAEKMCKKCPIASGLGIQTLALCTPPFTSASTATICQTAQGTNVTHTDAVFTPITDADLNLRSGAHPAAHSQKLYVDIGRNSVYCNYETMVALGASYEFATKNALDQYAVWLTGAILF